MPNNERYFKDKEFVEKLAQRIRELRNSNAHTQEVLIDQVHLTIGNYETGDKIPTLMSVLKICKYYKISIREFFDTDLFDYPPKE